MPVVTEARTVSVERKQVELPPKNKAETPAIAPSPPIRDRQAQRLIDLDAQINAVRTTFGKLGRGLGNAASVASATPALARGALIIDSTPQGEAYELIDSNNKHHVGKTPETLEDLPGGYAQVIFRREGFSDHTSSVWISAAKKTSVSWNFPED